MIKRLGMSFIVFAMVLTLLFGGISQASAQNPIPQTPAKPPIGPQNDLQSNIVQNEQGIWVKTATGAARPSGAKIAPQATGGPDDFGYTWNNAIPLSWIDAKAGTVITGMSGNSYGLRTGPITLPFPFKFYENSYTSLYIAASGYLSFTDQGSWPWQPHIPSPTLPNNMIAPYATALNLAASGTTNRIYYLAGGSAPNRYFVVEWYQVKNEDETYTFEAILYENGNIVFQYQQMTYTGGYACGVAGIEDSYGTIGLASVDYCDTESSNVAVGYYRPLPAAHVSVTPRDQSRFAHINEKFSFPLTIRNIGEMGADTFDLTSTSCGWQVSMSAANGMELLTDTDHDGAVDSGPIPQGSQAAILVKVQAPAFGNVGDACNISIAITSSLNNTLNKTARLHAAIPSSFTQVFMDNADGAMSINLIQPDRQELLKASPDQKYGYNASVTAKSDGYAYLWSDDGYNGKFGYENIEFALLDKNGKITRPVSSLTDNSATSTYSIYDYYPEMAVAANGRIGVTWTRELYNSKTSKYQYNIYFTVLDSAGNMAFQPVNLTNNTTWGTYNDLNVPNFYAIHLAATADNHFMITWVREYRLSGGEMDDLYYVVKDSSGGSVKALTKFTNATAGNDYFYSPSLTNLSNNQIFMAWTQRAGGISSNAYAVFDSSGGVVHPATTINMFAYMVDAVQLSSGRILIAGQEWGYEKSSINYSILDGTTFVQIKDDTELVNPYSLTGDNYVSVTADAAGRGILTWMDYDYDSRHNLYYALVDSNGNILTEPMIFRTSQTTDQVIQTSYYGNGNTTNKSIVPTTPDVDLKLAASPSAGGAPGGTAIMPVTITNMGVNKATSISLTATLPEGVTLSEASPAPDTSVSGVLTWAIPDLSFLGSGRIDLTVALPAGAVGTLHPINWSVNSAGPEANPADNAVTINVMESLQMWLPAILR